MLVNVVVGVQVATMLLLAVLWFTAGNWRLAFAQGCYAAATVVLFAKL